MILKKNTHDPIRIEYTVSEENINNAWGSLYYKLISVPVDKDYRGRNIKAYFVPGAGAYTAFTMMEYPTSTTIRDS